MKPGGIVSNSVPFGPAVAHEIVSALEPAAQHARVEFRRKIQDDLLAVIDRLALEQILDNLILNAIKYGAGKPIDLAVSVEGRFLLLSVSDQGIGMSAKDQARIFEPFERAVACHLL